MRFLLFLWILFFLIISCKKKSDPPAAKSDYRQSYYGYYPCIRIHYTKQPSDTTYKEQADSDYVEFGPGDHDSDLKVWLFDLKRQYKAILRKDNSLNFGIPFDTASMVGFFYRGDSIFVRYQALHTIDYYTFRGKKG
jgi:hypothetical protein